MSSYKQAREEADPYDPALCLAAANILADNGFIGRNPPVFIRPSNYEDKALGIDMLMRAVDEQGILKDWKLAFRVRKEIKMIGTVPLLDFRDRELDKIRAGTYQADFLIYAEKSFENIITVNLKPWLYRQKDCDEFGVKKDDPRGDGSHYYSAEAKDRGWQVIYYPMNLSGTRRISYKAKGELPSIFLSRESYDEACVLSVCDDFRIEEYL
jgi:hypothetical protein